MNSFMIPESVVNLYLQTFEHKAVNDLLLNKNTRRDSYEEGLFQ